jgi:hypothetical protein
MFQTDVAEKVKTHILCQRTFFKKRSWHLSDSVEKYCRAGQATHDNMAQARCKLDNKGYNHTLSEYVIYFFSSVTTVT